MQTGTAARRAYLWCDALCAEEFRVNQNIFYIIGVVVVVAVVVKFLF
jgi:hypothetical protein